MAVLGRMVNREDSLSRVDTTQGLAQQVKELPVNTSAYKLNTPLGLNNKDGIAELVSRADRRNWAPEETLKGAWFALRGIGVSPFIAYQAAQDLKGSVLPKVPDDADTWTYMGVGAERGLLRLQGLKPQDLVNWAHANGYVKSGAQMRDLSMKDTYVSGWIKRVLGVKDREAWGLKGAEKLLELSRLPELWPRDWPEWHLGEAEHMLCEFDKLERWRQIGPKGARLFK